MNIAGQAGLVKLGGNPVPGDTGLSAIKLLVPTQIVVPLTVDVALVGNAIGNGKFIAKVESSPGFPEAVVVYAANCTSPVMPVITDAPDSTIEYGNEATTVLILYSVADPAVIPVIVNPIN